MKVSVAVVTYDRERFMPALYESYARQTYPNTELLVFDDSPEPSAFFSRLRDPRVRYLHSTERLSIGAKRNLLVEKAVGDWICHFDDDDYYAENYIAQMLAYGRNVDFVKLTAWFNLSVATRTLTYWDTALPDTLTYRQNGSGIHPATARDLDLSAFQRHTIYGFGFNYFFRRRIGLRYPFREVSFAEDYPMVNDFMNAGGCINLVADQRGLVLHQLHASNTSWVLPQYRLPYFLLYQLFPGYPRYAQLLGHEAPSLPRRRQALPKPKSAAAMPGFQPRQQAVTPIPRLA